MDITIQQIWDNILSHIINFWHLYAIGLLILIILMLLMIRKNPTSDYKKRKRVRK